MSVFANNVLQVVQTYQRSGLKYLQNLCCMISTANKKFNEFNKIAANLGSSVTFDLTPLATVTAGLVASFQPAVQRVARLTVDQAFNASLAVTNQQRIFNVEKGPDEYINTFMESCLVKLANVVEENIALNWASAVVNNDTSIPNNPLIGTKNTFSGPFRFYGDGSTPLTSYQQLAQAIMQFKNWGSVAEGIKVYLPDTVVPAIVGSGLNQFAPYRNDEIAEAWEIGDFGTPLVKYYQSNLLPLHQSGTVGLNGQTLTVISTNDPTGQNVTQITFSGATASDAEAILSGDFLKFQDNVTGKPNLRLRVRYGQAVSASPVQFRATADAASDSSGNVVVNFTPALNWNSNGNQDTVTINTAIVSGMQCTVVPTHRRAGILGGDALFLAMPTLPDEVPYPTSAEYDPMTHAAIRLYYGSLFGQNQKGFVLDETHGSLIVPEYSMAYVIPLSQT